MAKIRVSVHPGARREELQVIDGGLKISVTQPPLEGRANERIVELLAKRLKVPRRQVTVVYGSRSRTKTVQIEDKTEDEIFAALAASS
jgi:uncharacterized protein (TIGR00251 family)